MDITAITIFPEIFTTLKYGLIGKALANKLVNFTAVNLRDYATGVHKAVDDTPYGGGPGMLMKPDVWGTALAANASAETTIVVPRPAAKLFKQATANYLATKSNLLFVCGRYEGIDERVFLYAKTNWEVVEYSLGDYVIAGGEVATLVAMEAIIRLLPGVLGNADSIHKDSFYTNNLLEAPQYTRPDTWKGLSVPKVLKSGNHQEIAKWKKEQSLKLTKENRPDLLGG